jgi:hypothetical protein
MVLHILIRRKNVTVTSNVKAHEGILVFEGGLRRMKLDT